VRKKFLIISLAIVICLVISAEALFVIVPSGVVAKAVKKRLMDDAGLVMELTSFKKVFPFGYEAKGVRLTGKKTGVKLYLTRIRAVFSPMSLIRLRPGLILSGDIYGGVLKGLVGRETRGIYATMVIKGATAPPIKAFGKIIPGVADISLDITTRETKTCPKGFLKARAKGGAIRDFSIMGFGIEEEKIFEDGLEIRFAGCRAYVKSAWIKSETFSARARGVLGMKGPPGNNPMEMRIEVSPKGKLMEDLNKLEFLRPYRRSAGYYRAVIRGTPSAPRISAE